MFPRTAGRPQKHPRRRAPKGKELPLALAAPIAGRPNGGGAAAKHPTRHPSRLVESRPRVGPPRGLL